MKKIYQSVLLTSAMWLLAFAALGQISDPSLLFFKNGEAFRRSGKPREAIREYDHALAFSDTSAVIYYWKGHCLMLIERTDSAVVALEKSIARDPRYLQAYNLLLKAYTIQKNDDMVVNTLERMAVNEDDKTKTVEYKLRAVQMLVRRNKGEEALAIAKRAILTDPSNVDALFAYAQVSNQLKHYADAEEALRKVITLNTSEDPQVLSKYYYELGYALHMMGDFANSETVFAKVTYGSYRYLITKLKPDYYYDLATSYMTIYDLQKATAMLEVALDIDANYPGAHVMLAELAMKENVPERSISAYKKALAGAADDERSQIKIYNALTESLIYMSRFKDALDYTEECLGKYPNNRNMLFLRSICLHKLDRSEAAASVLEQMLTDTGITQIEEVVYNFALGDIYTSLNQYEKARKAYAKAKKGPFSNAAQYSVELLSDKGEASIQQPK